jgi:hypothetical protein
MPTIWQLSTKKQTKIRVWTLHALSERKQKTFNQNPENAAKTTGEQVSLGVGI